MMLHLMHKLASLEHAMLHAGLDGVSVERLHRTLGFTLPAEHIEVLKTTNGIEADAGHVRLFGLFTTQSVDALVWNHDEYWKFAWDGRCSDFWCFGETCWGDQYAYSGASLRAKGNSAVYFLDAYSMTPRIIAPAFREFFEQEFLRVAHAPYDDVTRQAREKFGSLGLSDHLIYVPSLLLGGTEDITHVRVMDARAAMICNGDIAVQVDAAAPGSSVAGVHPYEDGLQRARLRLVWA